MHYPGSVADGHNDHGNEKKYKIISYLLQVLDI